MSLAVHPRHRRKISAVAAAAAILLVGGLAMAEMYRAERKKWLASATLTNLAAAAARHPGDAPLNFQYAFRLAESGRNEEGIQIMQRLTDRHPHEKAYWFGLARVSAGAGHPIRAEEAYLNVRRLNPSDPEVIFILGEMYSAAGLDSEAIALFDQGQKLGQATDGTRAAWAKSLYRLGRFDEAWQILAPSLAHFPMQDEPYLMLADLVPHVGRREEALAMLRRRLGMSRMYPSAVARAPLARILAREGDPKSLSEARELVLTALTDSRAKADTQAALAEIRLREQRPIEALAAVRAGLKHEEHEGCLDAGVRAARLLGRAKEAEELQRRLARVRPAVLPVPADAREATDLLARAGEYARAGRPGLAATLCLAAAQQPDVRDEARRLASEYHLKAIRTLSKERAGAARYLGQTPWAQ